MKVPAARRALVTGASRGIGESFARELAAAGADLVLVARSGDELDALARELGERHGVDAEVLATDLTDAAQLLEVEERLRTTDRPVDLLINNAGFGSTGAFHELDVDRETRQIRLHLTAALRLSHAFLARAVPEGSGWLLNVSSILSFQPGPNGAVYAACKAALRSFTEAVHDELRGTGVHVTALCPGFTRTAIFDVAGGDTSAVPGPLWKDAAEVARAGLDAVSRNRAVHVPGRPYQLLAVTSPRMLPRLRRRVSGIVSRRF